ncbi:MinD/ParA family ATP-binding protein [Actinomadura kijaniata]|uniref:MinD/ParA family ATP-binding protein n=1 Tax=Actinomadura kijaniata TaxID=46161 RepID=UPI000A640DC3|nr:MinD/ParA family protein [Actinomadura kijaniata]
MQFPGPPAPPPMPGMEPASQDAFGAQFAAPPAPPSMPGMEPVPQQDGDASGAQFAVPMADPPATGAFGASLAFGTIIGTEDDGAGAEQAAHQQSQQAAPQHPQGHVHAQELMRRDQHGDPLMRRVGRGVRKAVGGSSADLKLQSDFADLMARPVSGYRQIAVASVRGGAGKTTMSALIATELARARGDRVLAADADAELGSLPLRLGVLPERSLFDLAEYNPRSFEEAAQFLSRTPDGLWVLSSTRGGRIAGEFALDTFQNALGKVTRYVSSVIVDCGAGILTEVNRGVLTHSHGLVLVTPATVDGALSAKGALEWFAANQQQALITRTVVAMVAHAPQVGADLDKAQQMLTAWGVPVVLVPYDRHAGAGGPLDMAKVGVATRTAVIRIVHEVFARSLGAGR